MPLVDLEQHSSCHKGESRIVIACRQSLSNAVKGDSRAAVNVWLSGVL